METHAGDLSLHKAAKIAVCSAQFACRHPRVAAGFFAALQRSPRTPLREGGGEAVADSDPAQIVYPNSLQLLFSYAIIIKK